MLMLWKVDQILIYQQKYELEYLSVWNRMELDEAFLFGVLQLVIHYDSLR